MREDCRYPWFAGVAVEILNTEPGGLDQLRTFLHHILVGYFGKKGRNRVVPFRVLHTSRKPCVALENAPRHRCFEAERIQVTVYHLPYQPETTAV